MRWLVGLAILGVSPALAAAPQCAIPGPIQIAAADQAASTPTTHDPSPAPIAAKPDAKPTNALPSGLAGLPFVRHVAEAGATLIDLGTSHGLHMIAARHGSEFRVFSVLGNGQSAVEGAPVELTLQQLKDVATGSITPLDTRAGFDGLFVRSGAQFQVFYAAPDGQVVIPGILRDAHGKDLTREQVANIPGAIPTVEVTDPQAPSGARVGAAAQQAPATPEVLAAVEQATYGTIGPASAPQLFELVDPQCIYSVRAFQQLRSFAQAGRIRLSVVPLAILDYEDQGQSTRTALALLSKPTEQIVGAWQSGDVSRGPLASAAGEQLKRNMAIASAIGVKGTPTFIWRKADGTIGRIDGVPMDIAALVSSVGS